MGIQIDLCEWTVFRGKGHAWRHCVHVVSCGKMAELGEIPFGFCIRVGPRNHVLHGRAHWHHLVNTVEPSMHYGNAAFLSNYLDHLLSLLA